MHFWSMSFWCYKLENGELIKSLYSATVADTVHWSVKMDESADQIFSKTLREFLKDT